MITIEHVYLLGGAFFAAIALMSALDGANKKRIGNALFWGLLATSFLFGSHLSDLANGLIVLGLIGVGGTGLLGQSKPPTTSAEERAASAAKRQDWLFAPALIVPAVALFGALCLKNVAIGEAPLLQTSQATLISLVIGIAIALAVALAWLRPPPLAPLQEGRRLIDTVGWAAILPQMLASLGAVFALAGVGGEVGRIVALYLPLDAPFFAVAAFCIGMALFTMIMGNAFAAFPVMSAAIGLPLIVQRFGGDPAIMGAIGMLAGFCGTLMTPMAANFNIVPAALLELKDRDGVIKAQIPTAIPLLLCNIALMYFLVFRF